MEKCQQNQKAAHKLPSIFVKGEGVLVLDSEIKLNGFLEQ